ncbi:MAG TPA: tetratricopeptide repeat protein [Pyrinomonadaceae bacterium]|nr:tetratricopeptide repeat protein [Pyrinomonadaceae bacterium]
MKRTALTLLLLALLTPARDASAQTAPAVYSQNAEANELFLKAREYFNKSDPRVPGGKLSNAREAIRLYEQAVKKDPRFALAYVEMSRAWLQLGYSDPDRLSTNEILPRARAALLKALDLDKNSADVHRSLAALYYNIEYDWRKAEREYKLALRLAPESAPAHLGYAAFLGSMGRFDEALSEAKKADALAQSINTDIVLARLYYSMRRYEEAAEYCRKSLKKSDNVLGHFYLGFVYAAERKYDEAVAEFRTGANFSNNGGALAGLAYGYALSGKRDEALKIIEELKTTYGGSRVVPYRLAAVYLALGNSDRAIEWLRKDYEDRGNWMNQLKVDPVMDPLRSDPRFQKLMRLMKFKA